MTCEICEPDHKPHRGVLIYAHMMDDDVVITEFRACEDCADDTIERNNNNPDLALEWTYTTPPQWGDSIVITDGLYKGHRAMVTANLGDVCRVRLGRRRIEHTLTVHEFERVLR